MRLALQYDRREAGGSPTALSHAKGHSDTDCTGHGPLWIAGLATEQRLARAVEQHHIAWARMLLQCCDFLLKAQHALLQLLHSVLRGCARAACVQKH